MHIGEIDMVVIYDATSACKPDKPLYCPKCAKGRIGSVPEWSKTSQSPRGKPPPSEHGDYFHVKCPLCGAYVPLTIE